MRTRSIDMNNRVIVRCFALLVAVSMPLALFAQTGTVAGRVTDQDGNPLVGANVLIVGTNMGAATGMDGDYSMASVTAGDYKVSANYIGYATSSEQVSVLAGSVTELNFSLRASAIDMNEIVVTGTGVAVEKAKLGNTVGTVKMDELAGSPVSSVDQILTGRIPGVQVNLNGGLAGEGAEIRIRGTSSISQSNQPTIYVDGIRLDNSTNAGGMNWNGGVPGRMSEINPDAIERIEVLKGATASALYGSKATNGIINIITKQGAIGKPKFSFKMAQTTGSYDESRYKENTGFARTDDQASRMKHMFSADASSKSEGGSYSGKTWEIMSIPFAGMLYDKASGNTMSASVEGGVPGATYFANVRYQTFDGPFDNNATLGGLPVGDGNDADNKFMSSATLNILPSDNLKVRIHTFYTGRIQSTIQNNNNIYGITSLIQMGKPEFATALSYGDAVDNYTGSFAWATAREVTFRQLNSDLDNTLVSTTVTYTPGNNLTLKGNFGLNMTNGRGESYMPYRWAADNKSSYYRDGYLSIGRRQQKELTLDIRASHNMDMGNLSFETVGGFNANRMVRKFIEGWGNQFPGPGLQVLGALNAPQSGSSFVETIEAGYLFQERVGVGDYLFATLSMRLDATSTFGEEFQTVTYPRVGLSYLLTEMMGPLGPLSTLRLRGSWGQSGNQPGAFDQYTTYAPWSSLEGPGLRPGNVGNPALGPEITTETEVGFDFGILNDKIGGEFAYFSKITTDGLVPQSFPPSGGFANTQLTNIGEWTASGWELGLNANVVRSSQLTVDVYGALSYLEDELTSLGGAPEQKVGGSYPRYRNFLTKGFPIAALFGAKLVDTEYPIDLNNDGVCESKSELLAAFTGSETMSILSGWGPCLDVPTDADVTAKRAKTAGDRLAWYIGKPRPDYMGSFGANITIMRNIQINAMFETRFGNFGYSNLTDAFRKANPYIGRNIMGASITERDFMTGGVDASFNPKYDANERLAAAKEWVETWQSLSPYSGLNLVEDGDFVRFRELSITYRVPSETVSRFGLTNMSVSFAGRNIMLWTDYSGIDPELNAGSAQDGGLNMFRESIDAFGVPIPRTFTMSVNFGF